MSFHSLLAHLLLELNNTVSIYQSLSIPLLKDILVAPNFWQLRINLLINTFVQIFMWIGFQYLSKEAEYAEKYSTSKECEGLYSLRKE